MVENPENYLLASVGVSEVKGRDHQAMHVFRASPSYVYSDAV